jgi:hypothetical protein
MARFRPDKIFAVLQHHRVDYVTIGGIAATLHGSNLRTGDLDICPSVKASNLDRLAAALQDLRAKIRAVGAPYGIPVSIDASFLESLQLVNFTTRYGDFDVSFSPAGTSGFDDLSHNAGAFNLDGLIVPVASLEDVIRSKEAANRQKDRDQLPTLRALLEEIRKT